MNIKDILDSEITKEQFEERIMREGYQVLQVIQMPGWDLIVGALIMAKINAEKARKKTISKATTRENSLYWNGIVDGIEEAKEAIYQIIRSAEDVRRNQKNKDQMGDL